MQAGAGISDCEQHLLAPTELWASALLSSVITLLALLMLSGRRTLCKLKVELA